MAGQPDPRDFVKRADTRLTLLGRPLRFGGVDIPWLGLRQDGTAPARRPTAYEVRDVLATANALGAAVIRLPGLASTAGCALCLEPAPGQFNAEVFAQIDLVLKTARDLGLKVILPLADAGGDCAGPAGAGVVCADARLAPGRPARPGAFFTDPKAGAAFTARVAAILGHVNGLTGAVYGEDPTILAWEDCDGCGAAGDDRAVAAWVERLGRALKDKDHYHLYESGAFAGRIGPASATPVGAALFAPPSVDVVGDRLGVAGEAAGVRRAVGLQADALAGAGRPYVLDSVGWSTSLWKTEADLEAWLADLVRERRLTGALVARLDGHADSGGYLPPAAAAYPGQASLYFPGLATAEMDQPAMQERGRALRRFDFAMADITLAPAYLLPPRPEIVGVTHGRVVWRGAAGALSYTIERSPDPSAPGTWTTVCEGCATDAASAWQDPAVPAGAAWYRVMPFNINGHRAVPSAPVRSQ